MGRYCSYPLPNIQNLSQLNPAGQITRITLHYCSCSHLWDVGSLLVRDGVPVDAGEPGVVLEVLDAVLTQPHLRAANQPGLREK